MLSLLLSLSLSSCDLCVMLTNMVNDFVVQDYSDSQITQFISNICPSAPLQYVAPCESYIAVLPSILSGLRSGASPESLCANLSLCASPPDTNWLTCGLCEAAVTDSQVDCASFTGALRSKCELLAMGTAYFGRLLAAGHLPNSICRRVGYCEPRLRRPRVRASAQVCREVTIQIARQKDPGNFCETLNGQTAAACLSLVEEAGGEIARGIARGRSPESLRRAWIGR
jgi:hypothetical protein